VDRNVPRSATRVAQRISAFWPSPGIVRVHVGLPLTSLLSIFTYGCVFMCNLHISAMYSTHLNCNIKVLKY
jgi:hypothetical protein